MPVSPPLQAIPTNIITGFLGVGKTTAILHLLQKKPQHERWAVLVNEFGEVGIDGSILAGKSTAKDEIFIREVPGGCMCCAAGLPMQIALNRLLDKARPQRVLIEPTGLGHPAEIIALLRSEFYRTVLDLRATLTLVDARHFGDSRYTQNTTFQQQIEIADVLVANKNDLVDTAGTSALQRYQQDHHPEKVLHTVSFGQIDPAWLDLTNTSPTPPSLDLTPIFNSVDLPQVLPKSGFVRLDNQGDGYYSYGWIFSSDFLFDYEAVFLLLSGLTGERAKGIFITGNGVFAFNKTAEVLSEMELDDALDSRLEVIGNHLPDIQNLEQQLLACASEVD